MNGLDLYEDMDYFDDVFGDLDLTLLHAGERHRVFVYGTLLPGMRNHHRLERAGVERLSWHAQTSPKANDWRLASRVCGGGYLAPCLLPGLPEYAKGIVRGQVYEISGEVLMDLDRFEGHPEFYRREEHFVLWTDHKQKRHEQLVWMYVYQDDSERDKTGVKRTCVDAIADIYEWTGQ